MPQDFNITKVVNKTAAPSTSNGRQDQSNSTTRFADKPVTRSIAPLTEYNSDTGNLDVKADSPWGAKLDPKPDTTQQPQTPDRHTAWKAEQAAKRAEREQKKSEKQVQNQLLAKDFLQKGDLAGASNALGISPSDLIALVSNGALGIKPEVKTKTPEEIRTEEEAKFRADRLAFEKEQREWKYQQTAQSYIKDNISPVLVDKDSFEFIHQYDVKQIENYTYEYMNEHYRKTGEVLNAKDVLETIENEMYNSHVASLEKARGIKKVAKYFSPQEEQLDGTEEEQESVRKPAAREISLKEPTLANKAAKPLNSRFPVKTQEVEEEPEAEEEVNEVPQAIRRTNGTTSKTPFALLSHEERMARMRAESR